MMEADKVQGANLREQCYLACLLCGMLAIWHACYIWYSCYLACLLFGMLAIFGMLAVWHACRCTRAREQRWLAHGLTAHQCTESHCLAGPRRRHSEVCLQRVSLHNTAAIKKSSLGADGMFPLRLLLENNVFACLRGHGPSQGTPQRFGGGKVHHVGGANATFATCFALP